MLPKNIVYIHSHDTGRYIQPYGYSVPTPHLMKLATEATIFRHAYSAAPVCSASRCALLTSVYPHNNGMVGLAHRGFQMHEYGWHLCRFLSGQGYVTALAGVQHEIAQPRTKELGYDYCWREKEDRANAHYAAEFIRQSHEQPFFLAFGMMHTHKDYPVEHEGIHADYVVPPFPQYDNRANREEMARYMASAREMDACVGVVLDALKESGKEDETIVFYTTDHGLALPHMKCSLYDPGIGVALLLTYPGNPMRGRAIDSLVSHIDLFPTLCDLIGADQPAWLQGVSMLPLLEGGSVSIRQELFAEVTYHASYEPQRCVRTERYKLIRRFDDHDGVVSSNIDAGYGKSFLLNHGLLERKLAKEQLFDLYFDPTERHNVAQDPGYREVYRQLSGRLEQWMEDTGDLLLQGKYPKPADAKINKLSCIDPGDGDYE